MQTGSARSRIIIAGRSFPLPRGVRSITFEDPGGYNFYRDSTSNGDMSRKLVYDRRLKGAQVKTFEQLQQKVKNIVFHSDCTETSAVCYRVLVNRGLSTHFLIDWDGTIYQAADVLHKAIHGGEVNATSVGVDVNNRLPLFRPGDPVVPYESIFNGRHPEQFVDPEMKRPLSEFHEINLTRKRSYGYTDAQYKAVTALIKVLASQLPGLYNGKEGAVPQPPMNEKGEVVNRAIDGAKDWNGLLGHWHVSAGKWDPGPGFDWKRIFHALRGEDNAFPVELQEEQDSVERLTSSQMGGLAQEFYTNIESGSGGFYPVGVNQQWHGGTHLRTARGSEVRSMLGGTIVAARMTPPGELGSTNFVVVRHVLPMPREGDDPENPTLLKVYSLYMHLEYSDLTEITDEVHPRWIVDAWKKSGAAGAKDSSAADSGLGDGGKGSEESGLGSRGRQEPPYTRVGSGFPALRRGHVAMFEHGTGAALKVSSGEVIGRVGEFGPERTREALIHVEVFADSSWRNAIDLAIHGEHWVELAEDTGSTLQVTNRHVLSILGGRRRFRLGRKGFLFPRHQLSASDIEGFFHDEDTVQGREYLRRSITRHVSEWSDQVDWIQAMSEAQEWKDRVRDFEALLQDSSQRYRTGVFSREIQRILPFVWLTREVAEKMGLDVENWNGVLYHFHPIHFLEWLSFHSSNRVRVISRGKSRKELLKDVAKARERADRQRLNEERGVDQGPDGEELLDESLELDIEGKRFDSSTILERLRGVRGGGRWRWEYPEDDSH